MNTKFDPKMWKVDEENIANEDVPGPDPEEEEKKLL